jgi:hypothetical protein
MTNNATATNNVIIDQNSYGLVPLLSVGSNSPPTSVGAFINPTTLTGTNQYAMQVAAEATSAATAEVAGIVVRANTAAAAFTVANDYGIAIQNPTKGAGSTITNLYGLHIANQTAGGTNYGFYSAHTGLHVIEGTLNVGGLVTAADGLTVTGAGVQVGAPTGGDKGAGSINVAADIYKNDTAYTNPDYVFERYFKGHIRKFIGNPGAASYSGLMPLRDVQKHTEENLQLPGVAKASGMFERADVLLEKLEEAYLYIFQLNERIERLEGKIQ